MKRFIWIMILALWLAACTPEATPAPTEQPTSPPTATRTPEPSATPTTIPPSATPSSTPEPTVTATEAPTGPLAGYPAEGYGPGNFPDGVNPLTGLAVEDPSLLNRRPIAVKISNELREIRPQWGLTQADLVFEYYQEYGETRYHAIFYGNDASEAGPIRSARFPDEHFIRAYKSVFAFGSADYRVRNLLYSSDLANRLASVSDQPCPPNPTYPTCRIEPNGWNHLMTDTSILSQHFSQKGVENGRQNLDGLRFLADPPAGGLAANSLTVRFSKSHYHKWEYDSALGVYRRYDDTTTDFGEGETFQPATDRANGEPITASNVVVLFAEHSFYSREPEIVLVNLLGTGKAYVLRDGQMYLGRWSRPTAQDVIALTYEDGSPFPLRPGNTWFSVVGSFSSTPQESPEWRVQFQTP